MTTDQVRRVEIETRGQSKNDLWHQQRVGRVTASNFHTFHTKAQTILNRRSQNDKKPIYSSLVSSLLSESGDVSHLPQIKWGNAHEKDAIKSFMSDVASQHDGGLQGFNVDYSSSQTTPILQLHQMACFCANVVVCQLSKRSVPTVYEMKTFISRTHLIV